MNEKICLNLSTLMHLDFEEQLSVSSSAGFRAVGLREVNVNAFLSSGHTLGEARGMLDRFGLKSLEYNYFSDWIYTAEPDQGKTAERFVNFCRTAAALGDKPILIVPVSFAGKNDVLDYPLAQKNLQHLGERAREYRARVAVEFLPWTRFDTVGKVWKLVHEADMENVGIVLDTFHYFEGPSTREELEQVPPEKVFLIHLNDMKETKGNLLTRTRECRVLPGEGNYQFQEILEYLKDRRYEGYYSLEILNRDYKNRDPLEIASESMASMEKLLSAYS